MPEQPAELQVTSTSPARTRRLGSLLGELLRAGDVVLLEGAFGAGKTVFSQGVGEGLGVGDYVTSPSFTLINEYRAAPEHGGLRLYHIDLYRLEDPAEVVDLGLLEYAGGEGIVLVEWAERVRHLLPSEFLLVELAVTGVTKRTLRFVANGERHGALLADLTAAVAKGKNASGH